jgi:hypothetical protein
MSHAGRAHRVIGEIADDVALVWRSAEGKARERDAAAIRYVERRRNIRLPFSSFVAWRCEQGLVLRPAMTQVVQATPSDEIPIRDLIDAANAHCARTCRHGQRQRQFVLAILATAGHPTASICRAMKATPTDVFHAMEDARAERDWNPDFAAVVQAARDAK